MTNQIDKEIRKLRPKDFSKISNSKLQIQIRTSEGTIFLFT